MAGQTNTVDKSSPPICIHGRNNNIWENIQQEIVYIKKMFSQKSGKTAKIRIILKITVVYDISSMTFRLIKHIECVPVET